MANSPNSPIEDMALALLGDGVEQSIVASHLGVSESAISQLISRDDFAEKLITLRYENLSKHNERDKAYDLIEDELVTKMKESLPLLFRPESIMKAIQVINAAKRRGSSAPAATTTQQTVVKIVMPVRVINRFTTDMMNQVVEVGDQKLVTVQSGVLMQQLQKQQAKREGLLIEQGTLNGHARVETDSGPASTTRFESAQGGGNPASHPVSA